MKEFHYSTKRLAFCGILAGTYCALSVLTAPISYGPVQFRMAEALCILPFFAPFTALGLFVGCLLSNIFSTASALDVVLGSAATLIACLWTAKTRRLALAWLPTVIVNALFVGAMQAIAFTHGAFFQGFLLYAAQIALGETAVMLILGLPLAQLVCRRGWDEALRT